MPGSEAMMLLRAFKKAGISDRSMPLDLSRSISRGLRSSISRGHCIIKKVVLKAVAKKATLYQKRTVI
jgi:uncharacterized SAM-dependent methyltransferase